MKNKKTKAFTLIELMVAISILALLATGLLTAYTACVFLNLSNLNLAKAANNAQFVLEELASSSYSSITTQTYPSFGNLKDEAIAVDVTEIANKKEVLVEVGWTERNRDHNFKLFTVFHEDE
ncbi:MAG: type II secretion system GspH family protein [Candidatus Omnitrophica bacterium]|nr:type II secretion system GspH family protein [Candidatus Omnitrophota bacterium]MCF7878883.1 type II secretion system GspH family protein [Candidatus Omnitrophota bacterium]MCF7893722.1 type II secretion system GspH family protein [Candidatus Omnitrophota bacterium]